MKKIAMVSQAMGGKTEKEEYYIDLVFYNYIKKYRKVNFLKQ